MRDLVRKTATSPDGRERLVIVQRPGGRFSFCKQFRKGESRNDPHSFVGDWTADDEAEPGWTPPGPYVGIYDSAETAERQATGHVRWSPRFQDRG
jgi:hypothetical protein